MTSKTAATDRPDRLTPETVARIRARLEQLYGERADDCLQRILAAVGKYPIPDRPAGWSERDVVLITYGDQIKQDGGPALPALTEFLTSSGLTELINTVHVLPFFPYSSDDGFSVIDYRQVAPQIGDWDDMRQLSRHFDLMFDLVLNHCSQHSGWFQKYLAGEEPYARFFIEADPQADLTRVTRPRSSPLLTPFETSRGRRHLWTTFSADQVDLDFHEPAVLVEFIDILLFFVSQGMRIVRLDAVAYLWKEVGTSCIHLPQTHQVVKLLRDLVEAVAPHVLIITETNVPHRENVGYFGDGDEAHLVYQFSLPPLLLDAFLSRDGGPLRRWLDGLGTTPPGTTFFNFTASHDGIGVRPLEGLVTRQRFDRLVAAAQQRGGLIGTKRDADGNDTPYELNITYVDALGEPDGMDRSLHARRFLSSQAVMLALPGIPGVYFHSLLGTQNDDRGVRESGVARRINRRKFTLPELGAPLAEPDSLASQIFAGYRKLLERRIGQPAFHPDGACRLWDCGRPELLAFERSAPDGSQSILCVTNFAAEDRTFQHPRGGRDLLSAADVAAGSVNISAFQSMWIQM